MDPLDLVRFVKHGCVCFECEDTVVYVDPYHVPGQEHDADLVGITNGTTVSPTSPAMSQIGQSYLPDGIGFGIGVLLTLGGYRWYLSGDTDELDDDAACDVLFVCCDGVWNMPDFAVRVPAEIARMDRRPGLVVPYHYGGEAPGSEGNGAVLCQALSAQGIPCREWT